VAASARDERAERASRGSFSGRDRRRHAADDTQSQETPWHGQRRAPAV
jgi:hypothetical protein